MENNGGVFAEDWTLVRNIIWFIPCFPLLDTLYYDKVIRWHILVKWTDRQPYEAEHRKSEMTTCDRCGGHDRSQVWPAMQREKRLLWWIWELGRSVIGCQSTGFCQVHWFGVSSRGEHMRKHVGRCSEGFGRVMVMPAALNRKPSVASWMDGALLSRSEVARARKTSHCGQWSCCSLPTVMLFGVDEKVVTRIET